MRKTRFILPNAFTSMNFLLGVFAICWATGVFADFSTKDPFRMSAYFVILCVLLDKLDGFAARLVNASSDFGAQFDSLADLIAFGLAPAFGLFFCYKANAPKEWMADNLILILVVFSVYVLCAAMRLAKYNAMDSDAYHSVFSGLPSTFAGGLNVVVLSYATSKGLFDTAATGCTNCLYIPMIIMITSGILMVSPLFLPKLQPRKNKLFNSVQIILIIVTYISGFLFISPTIPYISEYLLILMGGYIVVGFGFGLVSRNQIIEEAKKEVKTAETNQ